jgi:hypothetical protein
MVRLQKSGIAQMASRERKRPEEDSRFLGALRSLYAVGSPICFTVDLAEVV